MYKIEELFIMNFLGLNYKEKTRNLPKELLGLI